MRSLGLDVGTVTIGVAISDPLGMFAQPVRTLGLHVLGQAPQGAERAELVREREVSRIIVGLPLRMDASEGDSAREARRMAEALGAALEGVTIVLQDERFSTAEAERALIEGNVRRSKRKQVIDQVAAVLILQSYLDQN